MINTFVSFVYFRESNDKPVVKDFLVYSENSDSNPIIPAGLRFQAKGFQSFFKLKLIHILM